jgi:hypothetical protein
MHLRIKNQTESSKDQERAFDQVANTAQETAKMLDQKGSLESDQSLSLGQLHAIDHKRSGERLGQR